MPPSPSPPSTPWEPDDALADPARVTRALLLTDRGARGRDLDAETRSIKLARVLGLTSPPSASCELFSVRLDGAGIRCAGAPRIGGVDHADWGATPASYAGVGDPEGDADRRDLVRALQGVALFPPPPPSRLVLLLARITHALPIAWRVTLHEAYESIFNASAASDIVWLGVDIDALATNVREWRFERKFGGRTLVVCDAPSTVPTGVALKRRCGDAVFLVSLRPQVGVADARFDLVGSGRPSGRGGRGSDESRRLPFGKVRARERDPTPPPRVRVDLRILHEARERWRVEFTHLRKSPRLVMYVTAPPVVRATSPARRLWELLAPATAKRKAVAEADAKLAASLSSFVPRARRSATKPGGGGFGSVFVAFAPSTTHALRVEVCRAFERAMRDQRAAAPSTATREDLKKPYACHELPRGQGVGTCARTDLASYVDLLPPYGPSEVDTTGAEYVQKEPKPWPRRRAFWEEWTFLFPIRRWLRGKPKRYPRPAFVPKASDFWVYDGARGSVDDPYEGALGWADALCVVASGADVLREAEAIGVPIFVAAWDACVKNGGSPAATLSHLATLGLARDVDDARVFEGENSEKWRGKSGGVDFSDAPIVGREPHNARDGWDGHTADVVGDNRDRGPCVVDDVTVTAARVSAAVEVKPWRIGIEPGTTGGRYDRYAPGSSSAKRAKDDDGGDDDDETPARALEFGLGDDGEVECEGFLFD